MITLPSCIMPQIIVKLKHCRNYVYDFELEKDTRQYRFEDDIAVCIYEDLSINIAGILS